jgi:hypothetical protein
MYLVAVLLGRHKDCRSRLVDNRPKPIAAARGSLERYAELLRLHILPVLGERPLQQLQATEIDALYEKLTEKISARTASNVHGVLVSCLGTAMRTRKLARNPMLELAKIPAPGEANHGMVLDD